MKTRIMALLVMVLGLAIPARTGNVVSGSQTCPTSGRKQITTTSTFVAWASIQAPIANTGTVFVGGSTITTSQGNGMLSLGSVYLNSWGNTFPYNLNQVYIACTVAGDSVTYLYLQ